MIARHGFKTVLVRNLKLPGDIEHRRKQQHVVDLQESYYATGGQPGNAPWVEFKTGKLIAGCDRLAAALNLGLKEIDVLMISGSPEELEIASLTENVRRRSRGHDDQIRRLLQLEHPSPAETFPEVEDEPPLAPAEPKRGRPATTGPKVAAVAEITGKTPAAVRQADYRARKDEEPEEDLPSFFDTRGLDVPEEVQRDAYVEHVFLEAVEKSLVKLQSDCTRHLVAYPQLKEALHATAAEARSNMPASVCPHCKLSKVQAQCLACRGRGWLRAREMVGISDRLLERGDRAVVFVAGKLTMLSEVA